VAQRPERDVVEPIVYAYNPVATSRAIVDAWRVARMNPIHALRLE
jgi:hypothetical protein